MEAGLLAHVSHQNLAAFRTEGILLSPRQLTVNN